METESTRLNHGYTGSLLQFVRSVAALVVSSGMSMSVPLCSSNCSALMQRLAGAPRWRRANPALLRYLCVFFSVAGTSLNAAAQTVVHGVVFDSLAGRALVGATVRMFALATPRDSALESMTDSVGRFRFADIPPGRYVIGFSHARLDSLGFDAVSRKVEFSQTGDTVALDIALPSGRTLVATLCGGLGADLGAMFGRVFQAADAHSAAQGSVRAEWRVQSLQGADRQVRVQFVRAPIGTDGRYVLCGIPTDVVVVSFAQLFLQTDASDPATDTTVLAVSGRIDVEASDTNPAVHRDFLVARTRRGPPLSSANGQAEVMIRVAGRVVDDAARPITGARLSLVDVSAVDSVVLSDERGMFAFNSAVEGSYMLQIAKLGYVARRVSLDIRSSDNPTREYVLTRSAFELEGVTVSARMAAEQAGFERRRSTRSGFFRTGADIAAEGAMFASAVLIHAPMLMQWGSNSAGRPVLTGPLRCTPLLFIDGVRAEMPVYRKSIATAPTATSGVYQPDVNVGESTPDLDNLVPPNQIGGVEVYSPGEAPARFADPFSRCSSIVMWTKAVVRER